MKEKYGGIDVLVNNAAIAFKQVQSEREGGRNGGEEVGYLETSW